MLMLILILILILIDAGQVPLGDHLDQSGASAGFGRSGPLDLDAGGCSRMQWFELKPRLVVSMHAICLSVIACSARSPSHNSPPLPALPCLSCCFCLHHRIQFGLRVTCISCFRCQISDPVLYPYYNVNTSRRRQTVLDGNVSLLT